VVDTYDISQITPQLTAELLSALQPVLGVISAQGIRHSELPSHTQELTMALNEALAGWTGQWGISIDSIGINSVTAPEEIREMIINLQKTAVFRNPDMAAAALVGAQSEAMVAAASNATAGPMMAFAGLNMAQNTGGMNATQLFGMAQQQQQQQQQQQGGFSGPQTPVGVVAGGGAATAVNGWTCPKCGEKDNTGRFCRECGAPKPSDAGWTCVCGAVNQGKFCQQCGKPKPYGAPLYKCDKCGWEPKDPTNPPKFCPECGDPFDENDAK
jgi:membrane protease subunit (stomatin/prohibitin family)